MKYLRMFISISLIIGVISAGCMSTPASNSSPSPIVTTTSSPGTQTNLANSSQNKETVELFWRAHELNNQGQSEEAIAIYKMVLEQDPNNADAWLGTSYAFYRLNRYEEALTACENELILKPNDALAWTHKGHILNALGRNEEAKKAYDISVQVLQDNPNHTISSQEQGYFEHAANENSGNKADSLLACRKGCFEKKRSCQEQCVKSEKEPSQQLICVNTCLDEEQMCNQQCDKG